MKKIMIIGSGGSGKSTLARILNELTGIQVYHLDKLLWMPNWSMTSREYQIEVQKELVKKESWIIDGNFSSTIDIRLKEADTIIFMDVNKFICIGHILKRYWMYREKSRPDMQDNCIEKFDYKFLKWVYNFPNIQKPQIMKKIEDLQLTSNVMIVKNKTDINKLIKSIQ